MGKFWVYVLNVEIKYIVMKVKLFLIVKIFMNYYFKCIFMWNYKILINVDFLFESINILENFDICN